MTNTHICTCGREWLITKHHSPMRDKDSESCLCGEELVSWNGGVTYSVRLVKDIKKDDKNRIFI
ncbi:hypothetical protein E0485_17410 [Paenibacillus albiflavus]|uniref:Uncharacterized protein n=1 Tax=Paenibacillus albiflavus TaxID=2545760 RepID=A0A4R4E8T0_9BACL|nr:hypothetical protein [Paenibacillus albiflavus]TCZ75383.1 hypothetical protein E0485_17410 [Paenibacillus albiflavus]